MQTKLSKTMQFRHSSAGVWWRQLIVIVTLVILNVTKVFSDDRFVAQQPYSSDSQSVPNSSINKTATFEEFFIEHNVSQKDAIKSFKEIGQKLLYSSEWAPRFPVDVEIAIGNFLWRQCVFNHILSYHFPFRFASAFMVCVNAVHRKYYDILSRWFDAAGSLLLWFTTPKWYVWPCGSVFLSLL